MHAALCLVVVLAGVAAQLHPARAPSSSPSPRCSSTSVRSWCCSCSASCSPGRPSSGDLETRPDTRPVPSASSSMPLLAMLGYTLWDGFEDTEVEVRTVQQTGMVGDSIFGQYLVPFEALSVLLLAALVGRHRAGEEGLIVLGLVNQFLFLVRRSCSPSASTASWPVRTA
ncbi:MAG: hypothetical protein U5R31_13095 [Acidimicrobiia bacterium]|nr:hypothetical protein [Acidimicrobiia bacterium]